MPKSTVEDFRNDSEEPKRRGKPKGAQKTGGRKKGTLNKNTIILPAILESAGFDFGKSIQETFQAADVDQRIKILTEIMKYFPLLSPLDTAEFLKQQEEPKPQLSTSDEKSILKGV